MEHDWYGHFRVASWMFAALFTLTNFCTWATKDMTNTYYYQRRKNGWWFLFWLAVLIGLSNWEW